ncbi:MAG: DUF1361 domain-containing protein [Halothece sp.]
MKARLIAWLINAWKVFQQSLPRIAWNSFLAFIPLVLSVWLFRQSKSRSWLWWLGVIVFIAFLPNAPYILTDIIHVINFARQGHSVWMLTLVVIPQYTLFIFAGFEAYVISLINVGYYLHRQGLSKYIIPAELFLHALSSAGIYLGRFKRFNSWDFVAQPNALAQSMIEDLVGKWPVLVMLITFGILTISYWLVKQVNLSIAFRWHHRNRLLQESSDYSEEYTAN